MTRDEIINMAKYLRETLGDDILTEIVRQECADAMNFCGEKERKHLRKTHNYFALMEDRIKKDK